MIQLGVAAADSNRPAFAKAGGRKLAADRDIASGAAAQNDRAAARAGRSDGEFARHVNRVADRPRDRRGLQLHQSPRGADLAGDVDQRPAVRRLRVRRDGDLEKIVAGQVQSRPLARAHRDLSERDRDDARIRDRSTEQADKTAGPCLNRASVGDARGRAVADKVEITLVEVAVGDPQGRGGETATDLNRAGRGDRDPVRIDEIDLAVGLQLTGDRRARRAGDAIQDRRGGARLIEGDAVHLPDRKAAPVDDRTRRGLDYGEVGARLTDRRRAGRNHAVRRQDVLGMSGHENKRRRQ